MKKLQLIILLQFSILMFAQANEVKWQEKQYPDSLEAVHKAPENHIVLFENENFRLLKIFVAAQKSEPVHSHRWPAIMWVFQPSDYEQVFYTENEKAERIPVQTITMKKNELPINVGFPVGKGDLGMSKNLGDQDLIAYRLDFKKDFDPSKKVAKSKDWTWGEDLDGVKIAPSSHQIVYEDDFTRILHVVLAKGEEEAVHTHQYPCSFWVVKSQPIEYSEFKMDKRGKLIKSKTHKLPPLPVDQLLDQNKISDPEPPHSVKNLGTENFEAYRIEFKKDFRN